jgi:hypothetical protein
LAHGVFRSGGGKIEGGLKAERVFMARSIRYFIKMPRPPAVFNHQNPFLCHSTPFSCSKKQKQTAFQAVVGAAPSIMHNVNKKNAKHNVMQMMITGRTP